MTEGLLDMCTYSGGVEAESSALYGRHNEGPIRQKKLTECGAVGVYLAQDSQLLNL